mmetsp:Transcript_24151/g.69704  ORF Transcript_24151/g.69704 Transcript_24151/m.69704 type:complete len:253 (+) Transcript_24151:783-1541(+)
MPAGAARRAPRVQVRTCSHPSSPLEAPQEMSREKNSELNAWTFRPPSARTSSPMKWSSRASFKCCSSSSLAQSTADNAENDNAAAAAASSRSPMLGVHASIKPLFSGTAFNSSFTIWSSSRTRWASSLTWCKARSCSCSTAAANTCLFTAEHNSWMSANWPMPFFISMEVASRSAPGTLMRRSASLSLASRAARLLSSSSRRLLASTPTACASTPATATAAATSRALGAAETEPAWSIAAARSLTAKARARL